LLSYTSAQRNSPLFSNNNTLEPDLPPTATQSLA
jgi:hypothetical protein